MTGTDYFTGAGIAHVAGEPAGGGEISTPIVAPRTRARTIRVVRS